MQDDQASQNQPVPADNQQAQTPVSDTPQQAGEPTKTVGQQPKPTVHLPEEAADTDLIEKQWVEKAKEIVDHTRDNPYEQQKALGKVREDYLKKRYNKESNTTDT